MNIMIKWSCWWSWCWWWCFIIMMTMMSRVGGLPSGRSTRSWITSSLLGFQKYFWSVLVEPGMSEREGHIFLCFLKWVPLQFWPFELWKPLDSNLQLSAKEKGMIFSRFRWLVNQRSIVITNEWFSLDNCSIAVFLGEMEVNFNI